MDLKNLHEYLCMCIWLGLVLVNFEVETSMSFSTENPTPSIISYEEERERCKYTEEEAEEGPWTATLKVRRENNHRAFDYYICTILDRYTVLTSGNGFETIADKLKIRPLGNYTVILESNRTVAQSLKVSIIQPYPHYGRRGGTGSKKYWMVSENDYVIVHLKDPIKFGPSVGPVCLPQLDPRVYNISVQLENLFIENTMTVINGWRKDRVLMSLTVTLASDEMCEKEWRNLTTAIVPQLPYRNRVCGYVSKAAKNNPDSKCFPFDSGAVVTQDGRYTFMGFVNTYERNPSKTEYCKGGAYFSIYKITPSVLKWLNATLECGPNQYTCHNRECAPLNSVCNQNKMDGCSDGSDEDGKYCRAFNQCRVDQFECGVYGECIPKYANGKEARNCDGIRDCPLNEDEEYCSKVASTDKSLIVILIAVIALLPILIPFAIFMLRRMKG